ncbi:MAG: helix-turn-helix domain-containing protein [Promicromonosporaceae bacterium]|nr:helix-turn-helix domain-containing protein [Promicromonosporaceae bacterium]
MILGSETGELVRSARLRAALSQQGLAERAGLRQQTVAAIESGRRQPTVSTLVRLVETLGWQLVVSLEPLDADVDRLLDDPDGAVRAREQAARQVELVTGLLRQAYRVEGAGALALLGAPVPVAILDIALADTPETLEWLTQRRHLGALVHVYRDNPKGDAWPTPLAVPPFECVMQAEYSRRLADDAEYPGRWVDPYVESRQWLKEATRDGAFWVATAVGLARARLVDPAEVADAVDVETAAGAVRVRPLGSLVADDASLARYLRVMRRRAAAAATSDVTAATDVRAPG